MIFHIVYLAFRGYNTLIYYIVSFAFIFRFRHGYFTVGNKFIILHIFHMKSSAFKMWSKYTNISHFIFCIQSWFKYMGISHCFISLVFLIIFF